MKPDSKAHRRAKWRLRQPVAAMFGAAALVLGFGGNAVPAEPYPTRMVRLVVPFPAGGTTDLFARHLAAKLAASLGQQFVVENRGGAGGTVAAASVATAEPDGYTLILGAVSTHAINQSLYPRLSYDVLRDFAPVAFVAEVPNVLVVNPRNIAATTVPAFIAEAKASPRKLSMASAGSGTSIHLAGEMFKQAAGIDLVHVPYRGSAPAINDLVAGHVDVIFDNIPSAIEQVRAGHIRAIAVTTAKRSPALPDTPTISESGLPGFETSAWFALFAPAGTPREIVEKLNEETRRALNSPDTRERYALVGADTRDLDPDALRAFVAAEIEKWAKVVKAGKVTSD